MRIFRTAQIKLKKIGAVRYFEWIGDAPKIHHILLEVSMKNFFKNPAAIALGFEIVSMLTIVHRTVSVISVSPIPLTLVLGFIQFSKFKFLHRN